MAKKRKKKSSPKKVSAPQHKLPTGFWSQVGAVALIAISILLIVAWFSAGGPVVQWIYDVSLKTMGYSVYILPILFVYIAVEIFRIEENQLPLAMKLGAGLLVLWTSGLFGLMKDSSGAGFGGFIGDAVNSGMLALVSSGVAVFVYTLFILVTLLFVVRISPLTIVQKIWQLIRGNTSEDDQNTKIMREAQASKTSGSQSIGELKLNAGVPTLDQTKLGNMKATGGRDKVAEEKAALVAVSDPNWKAPSLDLLEKKQSPADPGDVPHNAQIIKDTLGEFSIDVEMEGANIGPKVTQYTLKPPSGVKLTRITALETNIALNLAAQSLRIEAPIPGQDRKSVV